ncbi:hypothetical protein BsIDN1_01610 [Bacillus safensis]|uniref:Uncharacterized protein n=1 Tax=Bacillus safensis TaxID=561879 RepID=A0A5S9M091_BACIA|nr:hypothetical protein BsIDN1_01610 [Bacillus safensis]
MDVFYPEIYEIKQGYESFEIAFFAMIAYKLFFKKKQKKMKKKAFKMMRQVVNFFLGALTKR